MIEGGGGGDTLTCSRERGARGARRAARQEEEGQLGKEKRCTDDDGEFTTIFNTHFSIHLFIVVIYEKI